MDVEKSHTFLLFDIDGTLIRSAGAGRAAMERSFKDVYGVDDGFHEIHMMGRTDPSILMEALENRGLDWNAQEMERFQNTYFRYLEEEIEVPREGKKTCPGIEALLPELQKRPDVVLGLLTGNWRTSGLIKLRHFGLDVYFPVGAFGDDSSRREDLVPIVLERFKMQWGDRLEKEHVYVIGDTPLDIRCAKPHGVRTVAVATGFHTTEQLAPDAPDYLFEDFHDTEKVLAIFN